MPDHARLARPLLAAACTGAVVLCAVEATASAAPACGLGYLALEEGVTWTYKTSLADDAPAPKAGQIQVNHPKKLTIEVTSVEAEGERTRVELQETYGDIERATSLTCGEDGVRVSPHSFLFAAEPGGGVGMNLSSIEREGSSYPLDGLRPGSTWRESVEVDVERPATEGSGAEHLAGEALVEREFTVRRREPVTAGEERYRAFRVEYALSGVSTVEPELVDIPAGARGSMWFAPGVGVVRAKNRFSRVYELVDRTGGD